MLTFQWRGGELGDWVIHHYSDFHGSCIIQCFAAGPEPRKIAKQLEVPSELLLDYAAQFVRQKKMAGIEEMTDRQVLLGGDQP
jgi:hypothetical protein